MLSALDSLHTGAGWVILLVVLLGLLLLRAEKSERRATLTAIGLFGLSLAGAALAGVLRRNGLSLAADYLWPFSVFAEGMCVIYLVDLALFRVVMPAVRLRSPRILQDIVTGLAYIVWAFIWLRANRVDLTSLIATSAVVTAVIGISLQDTLGNILGGVAIHLDQSIQVGDWIRVDDVVGKVVEIRWRHTSLETRNWETCVIPNVFLVKNRFLVLGRREGEPVQWRRTVFFQVELRVPPTRVVEAVEKGLRSTELHGVAAGPEPLCFVAEYGDSSIKYGARYWLTDLPNDDAADSLVRTHVYFALMRAGIALSIPSQSVFLTEETPERHAERRERSLSERISALAQVDLFAGLHPEELQRLAVRLAAAPFAKGEVITRQGAQADWLYLLCSGKADVFLEADERRHRIQVAELNAGSVFGEMGLMTGEPRSATVIARTEVECYRLGKEAFQEILRSRPAVADEISSLLAQRRVELDAARETLDGEAQEALLSTTRRDILTAIRRFFGLDA